MSKYACIAARSSVRFRLKPDNSNSHEFELHRPSNKGTKLLLKVIKAIIIIMTACFPATSEYSCLASAKRVSYCILQQLLYEICCFLEQCLRHLTQYMQFFCTSHDTKVYNISQQITQHISKS